MVCLFGGSLFAVPAACDSCATALSVCSRKAGCTLCLPLPIAPFSIDEAPRLARHHATASQGSLSTYPDLGSDGDKGFQVRVPVRPTTRCMSRSAFEGPSPGEWVLDCWFRNLGSINYRLQLATLGGPYFHTFASESIAASSPWDTAK